MPLNQQTTAYLSTYGKASSTTSRFQILGDNRIMYPLQASGTMYDSSWPPHELGNGGTFVKNMLARGPALYSFGNPTDPGVGKMAVRLGVSTNSGGNVCNLGNIYATIHSTQRLDAGVHLTFMCNGEAVYQDTNGAQYGASIEQFQNNVGGTVTASASGTTVTGAGTTFLTAALGGAAGIYNGIYTPSLSLIAAGDLIEIIDGTNVFYHRIRGVTDNTHLAVYPALAGSGTAGRSYRILRSGYGSYSRIVPIYNNSASNVAFSFYNYYVGNNRSHTFPGTIECFTREASGGAASSHFTCPQNSASQDIQATDVVYYKQFLLYGYNTSISWSVAGFPTSFVTGFGATDFPAGNVSVIATDDQFISFEMLGDQLIAFFKNSAWQVQATGTVPEFQFYRLPLTVGPLLPPTQDFQTGFFTHPRPTVSSRNNVFYYSDKGLIQYDSGSFDAVSAPVFTEIKTDDILFTGYSLAFDPHTNSVILWNYGDEINIGFMYNLGETAWSVLRGNVGGTRTLNGITGIFNNANNGDALMFYNNSTETINYWDLTSGAPFNPSGFNTYDWEWDSVVISVGDQYGLFQPSGIQFDANVNPSAQWQLLGGKTPYNLTVLDSGTVQALDNRNLLGKKIDMPFLKVKLSDTHWGMVVGANLYMDGLGK